MLDTSGLRVFVTLTLGVALAGTPGLAPSGVSAETSARAAASEPEGPSAGPPATSLASGNARLVPSALTGSTTTPSGGPVTGPISPAPTLATRTAAVDFTGALGATTEAGRKVVYLTFDDGPDPRYTPQVLAELSRYQARATFFVVGQNLANYPQVAGQALAAGHTLGNHSWSHPLLPRLTWSGLDAEVGRTQHLLATRGTACLRPPYGALNRTTKAYAQAMGLRVVLWSVDTEDWQRPGAATIARRVLSEVTDGAIVLFHDGGGNRSQTVAALRVVLPALTRAGYEFHAVCEYR